MKNKSVIAVIIMMMITTFNANELFAQDIHFSQFMMAPLQLDPSMAGKFGGDYRGILNHRNQWSSVMNKPFVTFGGMFDMHFNQNGRKDNFFGGGISIYGDNAGTASMRTMYINLSLAYHIKLNQGQYLSAGLQGSMIQRSLNTADMRFDNQFDANLMGHNAALSNGENFGNMSFIKPGVSAGISYTFGDNSTINVVSNNGFSGRKINIGASVHHLNTPGYNFLQGGDEQLGLRYVLHTNNSFVISNTKIAIQPSGYFMLQRKATNIVLGSYFRLNLSERSKYTQIVKGAAMSLGAHYRIGDAVIAGMLMEMGSFAFGVSYDINVSGLSGVTNGRGGYEISIRYISPNPFMTRSQARFF
jgi:type IX secretion system PorP/SprF family membrane protein